MTTTIDEVALRIATEAHEGQTRWDKVTPYIEHPKAVAKSIRLVFRIELPVDLWNLAIAAAYLHDVVEDCPGYDLDRLWDELSNAVAFSFWIDHVEQITQVVRAVQALTKNPDRNEETYIQYLHRVASNPIARVVKMADLTHNLSDLDPKKDKNKIDKYQMAFYILKTYHEHQE